ncbi:RluA family pseudouridine synthase [Porphyromonas sp.]|uniref:RluA family pseudouridine synthase n=1 Tax=Porphyromonas sp. TaxID=1924944 RepID=UPI0026DC0607|nr:RNA pseudouridine synthase [Porphyromonas sp.]MDO4771442.1 RNA pseudouridine synthase [Porphyromonas sp.]
MTVLYEDNHLLIVNKAAGEIVQGDKTGDIPLVENLKTYLKEKYDKPGNVFLGLVHRLDRPVSGIVIFAKTSKALSRMNDLFRAHDKVKKTYHAIVEAPPARPEATLVHFLKKNEKQNKSYPVTSQTDGAKKAELSYRTLAHSDRYTLLEVQLKTGRHHQIRTQLSANGTIIKGDLKYGAKRSNPDGSISLHARSIEFVHPVSKELIRVTAPYPEGDALWQYFNK